MEGTKVRFKLWIVGAWLVLATVVFAFSAPQIRAAERICGVASYYGTESGSRTATGEKFDGRGMTAAMPSRSMLGKRVRVIYRGRSVVVRVNDIGPAKRLHRVIDLSKAAAAKLGMIDAGVGDVCFERIE